MLDISFKIGYNDMSDGLTIGIAVFAFFYCWMVFDVWRYILDRDE